MQRKQTFGFGPFHLDIANRQLFRGQRDLKLTGRAFEVLVYLVERPGQLVTKDNLFQGVWQETVVGDAALAVCIGELRKTLKDKAAWFRQACVTLGHESAYSNSRPNSL